MNQATEKRLMDCIDQTSSHVEAGMHPNEAVIKAAQATQLRPSEIDFVVRAYNTGATNRQRLKGTDPWEKSAEFDLADAKVVHDALYPTTEKQASAGAPAGVPRDTRVSLDYALSPQTMLERLAKREKVAASVDWRVINGERVEKPEPYPRDPHEEAMRKYAADQRKRQAFEAARGEKSAAMDRLRASFADLGEYFNRLDCTPLPNVKHAAALIHGADTTDSVFSRLAEHYPGLEKKAQNRSRQVKIASNNEGLGLVARVVVAAGEFTEKSAAFEAVAADQPDYPHLKQAAAKREIYLGSVLDEVPEKLAFNPFNMAGTLALTGQVFDKAKGALASGPSDQDLVQQNLARLDDPSHEAQLHEIETEANLHDLMANDPTISGYDPTEVTDAYNELAQTAPAALSNRAIMQSLLRKRLAQGTVDTFDMNQLLDLEKKIRSTQPGPSMKGVGADGSVL